MDEFNHLSVKDKKNITTVVLYLGAVVEMQDYSLAGEVAVVSALKSLDEKVSSHLYEKYRDDIPTLPNTPRDGTVEYELCKLEQVVGNARISLNKNEYDTEDE